MRSTYEQFGTRLLHDCHPMNNANKMAKVMPCMISKNAGDGA